MKGESAVKPSRRDKVKRGGRGVLTVYGDGLYCHEVEAGACGYVVCRDQEVILQGNRYLVGRWTAGLAECAALIKALRAALAAGLRGECLEARSDSLSLVNQLRGEHRIRSPRLESLVEATRALAGRFRDHAFTWVPRADNGEAHRLARLALARGRAGGEERRDASLSLDEMMWRAVFAEWCHGYPRQSLVS